MSVEAPWVVRAALQLVPRTWRPSVQQDLFDETAHNWWGWCRCACAAIGIAIALHWMFTRATLMSDMRSAIRSIVRARAFALGAIATFALGIGVNVAVFSAVDRMLFRPLPYAQPEQLVVMGEFSVGETMPFGTVMANEVVQVRRLPGIADAAVSTWNADSFRLVQSPDGAKYFSFVEVSHNMLDVLGVRPVIGQDFSEDDARAKRARVLISHAVWQLEFGGRADVVGRSVWSDSGGRVADIAGVLPADFIPPQVVIPNLNWSGVSVTDDTFDVAGPKDRSTPPFVRLKPGVTVAAAQAQVDALLAQLRAQDPPPPPGSENIHMRLVPLRESLFGRYRTYLTLVFTAATLVLLVGCANLASLLLVRARSREHVVAVQLALGASPWRVMQAAVIEALFLAGVGCAVALAVLAVSNQLIASWLPPLFSKYAAPVLASRIMIFSAALAAVSAVVAGVLPGWRSSRVDVLSVLQRGAGRIGSSRLRGGATMLAAEVAVSLVLVACAALTARSLVGLLRTDVGFDMERLHLVDALLPPSKDPVLLRQQYGDMLEILRRVPGVQVAAGADVLPMIGALAQPMRPGNDRRGQRWSVTEDFVETMGMRVVAGRTMSAAEVRAMTPVGLLSESGLALVWPGVTAAEAPGRFLEFEGEAPRQVVGVVSDVRSRYDDSPTPSLYVPLGSDHFRYMMYAVRLAPGAAISVPALSARLEQAGYRPRRALSASAVTARFNRGILDQKFRAQLFSAFGFVALLLAVVGLYAVQSFNVGMRQREFGIRLSLGATPHDLWRMLIVQTFRPVIIGIALGIVATYWAAQFLQSFLVQVDARDPWTYALVSLVLLVAALSAVWLPARRAARVSPAVVLRGQ